MTIKLSERRAAKKARRVYLLAQLEHEMLDNQHRLREIEERRNRPCPICERQSWGRGR